MKFFFILCFSIFLQAFDRFPQNCTEFLSPPNSNFLTSKSLFKLKPTPIKVHLIPHSHMDIGWIKTYDETYPVFEKIMNSVFEVLIKDFSKSFVLSELAFFNIWWVNQTLVNQNLFKGLISRGQIEFVGGGWCMNDEATTYYEEIIDQMTLGHEFLKKHLNISVKIGWQIDTFGHSASQAKISSQMGIDAMILNRIDYQDKIKRVNEKGLEFMWKPFLKGDALFTGVTYYHYESPIYLCDDSIVYCSYSGFQNFNKWFKLEKKAEELASYFRNMSLSYQHNDILMHTLGTDFSFQNASISFDNVDKLINIVNANPQWGVSIVYSTVSKYLKDIQSLNISYHQKNDDFLPYADFPNGYWSGFYSNRPAVKYFIRNSGRFLQTVRSLFAVSQLGNIYKDLQKEMKDKIYELEKVMGLLQHHDTITGTSPQRVIDDFIVMAKDSVEEVKNTLFAFLMEKHYKLFEEKHSFVTCDWKEKKSQCSTDLYSMLLKSKSVLVSLYNSGFQKDEIIRIRIPQNKIFQVLDASNEKIKSDIICSSYGETSDCTLFFILNLQTSSFSYVKILPESSYLKKVTNVGKKINFNGKEQLEVKINQKFGIKIKKDLKNFLIFNKRGNFPFKLSYNYYKSYFYKAFDLDQRSGNYVFRPTNDSFDKIMYGSPEEATLYKGENIIQISINSGNVITNIRLFGLIEDYESAIEIETYLKEVPIDDSIGKEITMTIETDLQNNGEFYTDSNGLHMQKRKINSRPTWNLTEINPISGNYYPVTSIISINDSSRKLAIVSDRSQGGSSLKNGEIEIMIQRRLLTVDCKGISEPLDEIEDGINGTRILMTHYLLFETLEENNERKIQYRLDTYPLLILSPSNQLDFIRKPIEFYIEQYFEFDHYVKFSLKDLGSERFLLRFMNIDDKINKKFSIREIFDWEERTLDGVLSLEEEKIQRFKWNFEEKNEEKPEKISQFTLDPLEIKTFVIKKKI